uniref:START domain-containing protein n=1 Tax=Opuntia streptacantha TaxID=393608 RepID=A0A7C9EMP5_OPUST
MQIDRISAIAAKYVGKPLVSSYPHMSSPPLPSRSSLDLGVGAFGPQSGVIGDMYTPAGDLLRSVGPPTEADKPMIIELAVAAMEELIRMAQAVEPLWVPSPDNTTEILNEEEYFRSFPRGIGPTPLGLKSEASRDSAVVIMNHMNLVEILMDVVSPTILLLFFEAKSQFLA